MHSSAFVELSLVIALAAAVSFFMRLIRQPLILGYILTGLLVGPAVLGLLEANDAFNTFSSIGIALLLFIIGLGLNVSIIKKLGKTVFATAAIELLTMGLVGYLIGMALGFSQLEGIIMGLALFFSSTIVVVKILADKKEQNRLHGQIAIGILLIEDIVATLALLFVAAGKDNSFSLSTLYGLALKGVLLAAFLVLASSKILPKLAKFMAGSQELLFLFAIGWGFGIASLFEYFGFSIEVGALFAGVALASLPYSQEIEARLKPLRDFFVVLFFIVLGESLHLNNLKTAILPALLLSAAVVILKPGTITTALGLMGYPKRVSFKAGINLSQISEFSIVLVVLAASSGLVRAEIGAVITMVAMITIAISTYLTHFDSALFAKFDRSKIYWFERVNARKEKRNNVAYPLILFGYHKGGHEFVRTFKSIGKRFIVIDYDPAVIESLQQQQIPCMYGDATDVELLDEVGTQSAKLVVSTVTDFETTQQLVRHLNLYNPSATIICSANSYDEALQLYELGSTYVMIPHFIGSERLGTFIRKNGLSREAFKQYRQKHLSYLETNHPISAAEEAV